MADVYSNRKVELTGFDETGHDFNDINTSNTGSINPTSGNIGSMGTAGQSGQGSGGGVMEKAKDYGKTAVQKVDQNRDKAASLLTTGAQKVRQWGGNTQYGQKVETAAQGLEKAANYVRERDLNAMGGDVGNWVRQSPTQAVLVALGAGFLLGYTMKRR